MAATPNRALKFLYFALGISLPLAGFLVWRQAASSRKLGMKQHREELQEKAVEDSFPASDPPATW